ncbi:MAG: class I SAM-dependent methyltransferase [Anaerolinea sp.]|nr:class I SAM-dependent methyltransferase [Anaerolinea sp.]
MTQTDTAPPPDQWNAYWEEQAQTAFISAPVEPWEALCSYTAVSGMRVLDLATGTGGTAARLAAAGAAVTAVDLSERSLHIARTTAQRQATDVALLCADVLHLALPDEAFDGVVSLGVMHYFRDPRPFLAEVSRVLRLGGWALIEVPQKFSPFTLHKRWRMAQGRWEYGDWETEYSPEELRRLLSHNGFTPAQSYAREYYPYAYYALRHLAKLEQRLGLPLLPASIWQAYDRVWTRLETGWWGLHTLRDVGIVARKDRVP